MTSPLETDNYIKLRAGAYACAALSFLVWDPVESMD